MNKEKVFNITIIILFAIFMTIYLSSNRGYYEYGLYKKVELTNDEIKRFEEDVKNNKSIDVEKYLKDSTKDYTNEVSKISLSISKFTSKYIKKGIDGIFKTIDKLMS